MSARVDEEWLHRAAAAFERGDLDTAERLAQERLDTHPRDERAENVLDEIAWARMPASEGPEGPAFGAPGISELRWGTRRFARPSPPADGAPQAAPPGLATPPLGAVIVAGLHAAGALALGLFALVLFFSDWRGVLPAVAVLSVAGASFLIALGLWRLNALAWGLAVALQIAGLAYQVPPLLEGDPAALSFMLMHGVLLTALLLGRRAFLDKASRDADAPGPGA